MIMSNSDAPTASRPASGKAKVGFRNPKKSFADVDSALVAQLISAGVDVAFVIENGVILDFAASAADLNVEDPERSWRNAPFADIVTPESRPKVETMLSTGVGDGRWRQLSHPSPAGFDIPVNYTTVRVGKTNRILALGQEMRSVAILQQRLVRTHQELEREYDRLRHAEARYRDLFDAMSEPVAVLDAESLVIRELNPAARTLLDVGENEAGGPFLDKFAKDAGRAIGRSLERALAVGHADVHKLRIKRRGEWTLRVSAFRHDDSVSLIVRFDDGDRSGLAADRTADLTLQSVVQNLPDALVITTSSLRVLQVNGTFLRMIHLVDERRAVGDDLANWLGRSSTELNMLMSNLKNYGVVRNFATVIRDRFGVEEEVEVSAVAAPVNGEAVYGFAIRNTTRRLPAGPDLRAQLPNSVDQVTNLVGRLPLKEIVRESTDLIERLCIDAALKIADDNRASAAEILGLSRQGLYSKLKRFGIDE
ncbi:MAG: transcriptional regulator PpsR [Alphaproteobacteria bacterium]|nr:transcriptional regulator PpsR [Alphaproteobacteria bacterium]